MPDVDRQRLAEAQAALMRALTTMAPAPPQFAARQVELAARSLLSKRMRGVVRAWPILERELGESFIPLFRDFALVHSLPEVGGPLADGLFFAEELRRHGKLPLPVEPDLLAVRQYYRVVGRGLVPRGKLSRLVSYVSQLVAHLWQRNRFIGSHESEFHERPFGGDRTIVGEIE